MIKLVRIAIGGICAAIGVIGFILPGSILFLLAGLLILSYDFPQARKLLTRAQQAFAQSARWLDQQIANRRRSR